jgi:hypothetical protein
MTGCVVQLVKHLSGEHKALSSNLSTVEEGEGEGKEKKKKESVEISSQALGTHTSNPSSLGG